MMNVPALNGMQQQHCSSLMGAQKRGGKRVKLLDRQVSRENKNDFIFG